MNYQFLSYTAENRIASLTLNRAEKKNALNHGLVGELKHALKEAADDKAVKVIILRANGDVFSAGADLEYLQQLQQNSYDDNLADSIHLAELFEQIYLHPKPVIACVEGHAIAGGCGLATVCDLVFSIPEAQFGYTEVKIGFIPALVSVFLLRKIGEAKAKELLLTGKLIAAETAKEFGLINFVYPQSVIRERVETMSIKLCEETSSVSLKFTKQLIAKVQDLSLTDALYQAASMNAHARSGEDCKKGVQAFLNKEKISW